MFNDIITINGNELNKKYVESLNKEERIELIEPIFHYFRNIGFLYPDDTEKLKTEWRRLSSFSSDIENKIMFNNSNIGTFICKYFCKSFYNSADPKHSSIVELFENDDILKSIIRNRLGIDWYHQKGENDVEAFPISFRQIVQGFRSSRKSSVISMFKPSVAKILYEKYSSVGDVVYDFSMGFGGRLLGAMSCGRKYIGVDPLTSTELLEMCRFFNFSEYTLIRGISEELILSNNSIDFAMSSPPYFNQEIYSKDKDQAYNKGETYFYDIYWEKTLNNIHNMLKNGKIFALNVQNCPKMVEMANEKFVHIDTLYLKTIRSHLNKTAGVEKMEPIYIFIK